MKNHVASYRVSKVKQPPPLRGGDRGEGKKSFTNHPHLTFPLKGEEYTETLQQAAGNYKLNKRSRFDALMTIETIRNFIKDEKYEFYAHAITEAKKDGVEPDDIIYVLLTGKIIEQYPEKQRALVYGKMINGLPLHTVCNYFDPDMLYIVTVYITSDEEWDRNYQERKKGEKR